MAADKVATASSSTSIVSPMEAFPAIHITLTKEEFNMFHNIDRQLFSRLVLNLGREPTESMQVMALLMWLEKSIKNSWVVYSLLTWPDNLLNTVVYEVVMALSCINGENFSSSDAKNDLPLMQILTRSSINLVFFHENSRDIVPAITKLLSDVCIGAFNDIIHEVQHKKATKKDAPLEKMMMRKGQNLNHHPITPANQIFFGMRPTQQMGYYNRRFPVGPVVRPIVASAEVVPHHHLVGKAAQPVWMQSKANNGRSYYWSDTQNFDLSCERDNLNDELSEFLDGLDLDDGGDGLELNDGDNNAGEASEVHPDNRTIFVTFSKGYPISESDVLDFFTRKYGDIVEAIHMQEVAPLEQPLYARLVIRPAAIHMIQVILEGKIRKFNINGKHAWARKYVPKNADKSPQF